DHCTVALNTSGQDGGTRGYGGGLLNAGTADIASTTFSNNAAAGGGQGGAIYNLGSAILTNSTIARNYSTDSAGAGGGAGAIYSDGQTDLKNCTIFGNWRVGSVAGGGMLQSVASSAANLPALVNGTYAGSDSPAYGTAGVVSAAPTPVVSAI